MEEVEEEGEDGEEEEEHAPAHGLYFVVVVVRVSCDILEYYSARCHDALAIIPAGCFVLF